MAEVTNPVAMFPGVVASVTYDDATLLIVRVHVVNNSSVPVTATLIKTYPKPKKTYEHTWQPGEDTAFSIPPGQCYYTWDAVDNNITMDGLTLYVRYGS